MINRRNTTYSSHMTDPSHENSSYNFDSPHNSTERPVSAAQYSRSSFVSKRKRRPRWPLIILIIVVILVIVIVGVSLSTCNDNKSSTSSSDPLETTNSYDWDDLHWDGDRAEYRDGLFLRSQLGVDVSDHQEYIDWEAVANDGISFASIRLGNRGYTEGLLAIDDYAAYNLDAAKEAGLEIGAYFYSQATTVQEAVEEAELALQVLDGRSLDLPVVFDHERVPSDNGRANDITGEDLVDITVAFCERIEQEGYQTMIYGNPSDLSRYLGVSFGNRQIWLAQYETSQPTVRFEFAIWQYTDNGTVDGIDTPVDLDIRFLDAL